MNKFLLFFILTLCANRSLSQSVIVDANARVRDLAGEFTSITVAGGIQLYLNQSSQSGIAVSASDEKYISGIKTEIMNGHLDIRYTGDRNLKNKKIKVYASFKELKSLEISGACDVVGMDKIVSSDLKISLSGASDLKALIETVRLDIKLSGASNVRLSGFTSEVIIQTSGASDVHAYALSADKCTATASGASDIKITVNKELSASAKGASEITFMGSPLIKMENRAGASAIRRKG